MILALLACGGHPTDALTWRESIELLGLLDGQGLLDARITVGNTGALRGQGRLRVERWSSTEDPILFSQHGAPQQVSRGSDGITLLQDGLREEDGVWELRVVSDALSGQLTLTPTVTASAESAWLEGDRQWTVAAPVPAGRLSGWLSAGERGGAARGVGVLLRRGGDGVPALPRTAAFVLSSRVSLGFDAHGGGTLTWAIIDGAQVPSAALHADLTAPTPTLRLPEAGLTVTLHPWRWDGTSEPMDHLLGLEAMLGGLILGRPVRRIRAARAEIVLSGETLAGQGILLDVVPASQAR